MCALGQHYLQIIIGFYTGVLALAQAAYYGNIRPGQGPERRRNEGRGPVLGRWGRDRGNP